jgi:hypothetical protein
MLCAKHESLRRVWISARADYQLALADLQDKSRADEFRNALRRANEAFAEFNNAETALTRHLERHGCAFIYVARAAGQSVQSVN